MSWVTAVLVVGKIIDKVFSDADQASKAKTALTEMAIKGELDELAQQAGVIKAEAQGESWLQRSWRPLVMLVFTALIVCRWMGWVSPDLSEALELKLLGIVSLVSVVTLPAGVWRRWQRVFVDESFPVKELQ